MPRSSQHPFCAGGVVKDLFIVSRVCKQLLEVLTDQEMLLFAVVRYEDLFTGQCPATNSGHGAWWKLEHLSAPTRTHV